MESSPLRITAVTGLYILMALSPVTWAHLSQSLAGGRGGESQSIDGLASPTPTSGSKAGTVVATVPVGIYPVGVAYDSGNEYIYVTNQFSNTTSVILGTNVIATVPVGNNPEGLDYDSGNGHIYVANAASNDVSIIDGTSVVATVPVGNSPEGIAYDSGNGYIYVANHVSGTVSVINGTTVVATVPVGDEPVGVAYDSGNGYVYVANLASNTVSVINGTTLAATVSVGEQPIGIGYDNGNGYVYVTNFAFGKVSVIDGATVIATFSVGSFPYGVAYDSGNGYVYVADDTYPSGSVTVVNGTVVLSTISVGAAPIGVGYDSGNGNIYVANSFDNTVSVISTAVVVPFDYSLSNSGPVSIQQGMSGNVTVTAILNSGSAQSVTLSCVTPLPLGISCSSFNPGSVMPTPSGATSTLTISVASSVVASSYSLEVTGTPLGATTIPTTINVIVTSPPKGDFSIAIRPSSITINAGSARNLAIVLKSSGFAGNISLTATITPVTITGPTVRLTATSVILTRNAGDTSTLTVTTSSATPLGIYTVKVTGTSGSLSHSASAVVTVKTL